MKHSRIFKMDYRYRIVGHTDYRTTANICTHNMDEMLKKATVNMNEVFQRRMED